MLQSIAPADTAGQRLTRIAALVGGSTSGCRPRPRVRTRKLVLHARAAQPSWSGTPESAVDPDPGQQRAAGEPKKMRRRYKSAGAFQI